MGLDDAITLHRSSTTNAGVIDGGYLKLTTNGLEQYGTAVFHMPNMDMADSFDASFKVLISGALESSLAGEGVSFCVGDLPQVAFDEHGDKSGLCVLSFPGLHLEYVTYRCW